MRELAVSQNSRHILARAGCGPGTPGAAGLGGVSWRSEYGPHTQAGPGHPVLGRSPNRLCLQNVSSVPPPPPTTSPRVLGGWERARRDLRETRRQPNPRPVPQSPSPSWLRGSIRPRFPVFGFPLQSIGRNVHFKREICRIQRLIPRKV